jgi:hypothetical protein
METPDLRKGIEKLDWRITLRLIVKKGAMKIWT